MRERTASQVGKAHVMKSDGPFQKIFNHSNDAIFILDPETDRILDVNPRACTMLGYSREELLATPVSEIHRFDLSFFRVFGEAVFEQGHAWTDELTCVMKSGEVLESEVSASIMEWKGRSVIIALVRDVSKRNQAEAALRASEERYRKLYNSTPVMMHSINEAGIIIDVNDYWLERLGYEREDVLGHRIVDFLTEASRQRALEIELPKAIRRRAAHEVEYQMVKKGGDLIDILLSARFEEGPVEQGLIGRVFIVDITERKRTEHALRKAQDENIQLQEILKTTHDFEEIVGNSRAIRKVFTQIERVAPTDTTVLITGETGTGKELVARALHNRSTRANQVFMAVNCAALPSALIESELFGHEKGAFTGATTQRKGRFELADGGTLFLDEIGELPPETQVKLLRVLQEQEFERVGDPKTRRVNVRVIAATNRDLEAAVQKGTFRSDLFYRLNIFPLQLPPLRERRDDIPHLASYFIDKFTRRIGKNISSIAPEALDKLMHYEWPGNVRELANVIERAMILSDSEILQATDIGLSTSKTTTSEALVTLEEAERRHIVRALKQTNGVVGGAHGAAALLGLNRTTLLFRMKKLDITREEVVLGALPV